MLEAIRWLQFLIYAPNSFLVPLGEPPNQLRMITVQIYRMSSCLVVLQISLLPLIVRGIRCAHTELLSSLLKPTYMLHACCRRRLRACLMYG